MPHSSLVPASRRRVLLASLAAVAASAGLTVAAQDAQAAFTISACGGSSAANQGASFQKDAQSYWRSVFTGSNGCGGSPTLPTYIANGSGNGRASFGAAGGSSSLSCAAGGSCTAPLAAGVRDITTAFASSDEGPTPTQQAAMNAGGPSASDDGVVHVIPAATGATAIVLHAPNGCDLSTITDKTGGEAGAAATGNTLADLTQRPRISNAKLEAAFAGDTTANTWGKLTPGISGTTAAAPGQAAGQDCAGLAVKRIVRRDDSGTTYAFKSFLSLTSATRGWATGALIASPNNKWPAGGSGAVSATAIGTNAGVDDFCADTAANLLCSGATDGAGGLATAVKNTAGSIGYLDLATARPEFTITKKADNGGAQDYTFWVPVANNPGAASTSFVEPASDPASNVKNVGGKGANCGDVQVKQAPTPADSPNGDPTLGDWSKAYAAGGAGYSNCVLTYVMAWDDSAPVYGNTPAEEAKARTVKDYLTNSVLSAAGQKFTNNDYSQVPNSNAQPLLKYSQDAVSLINWNKSASAGGGGTPVTPVAPVVPVAPVAPVAPIAPIKPVAPVTPTAPSNNVIVSSPKVNKAGTQITYSVRVPGAGKLRAVSTYVKKGKTQKVSTLSVTTKGSTKITVRIKLGKKARKDLKSFKRLRISTRVTFTPTGGKAKTVRRAVNVRVAKKSKK